MKPGRLFYYLLLCFALTVIRVSDSFAQEADLVSKEVAERKGSDSDDVKYIEDESLVTSENGDESTIEKDSLVIVSKQPLSNQRQVRGRAHQENRSTHDQQKQVEKEKKDKESILSFNFFYYIFRKFKLSDIVD